MKKSLIIALAIVFCLGMCACSKKAPESNASDSSDTVKKEAQAPEETSKPADLKEGSGLDNSDGNHGDTTAPAPAPRDTGASAQPRPKIKMENPTVTGSIDKRIIQKVVRQYIGELRACYENELNAVPNLEGKVIVTWVINPKGSVPNAAIKESSMNNKNVENCIVNSIKTWRFPAPKGGGTAKVDYPCVFELSHQDNAEQAANPNNANPDEKLNFKLDDDTQKYIDSIPKSAPMPDYHNPFDDEDDEDDDEDDDDEDGTEGFYAQLNYIANEAKKCGSSGDLIIAFMIDDDGNYQGLRTIGGSLAGAPEEKCILDTFKQYSFPDYAGAMIFKYTIYLNSSEFE